MSTLGLSYVDLDPAFTTISLGRFLLALRLSKAPVYSQKPLLHCSCCRASCLLVLPAASDCLLALLVTFGFLLLQLAADLQLCGFACSIFLLSESVGQETTTVARLTCPRRGSRRNANVGIKLIEAGFLQHMVYSSHLCEQLNRHRTSSPSQTYILLFGSRPYES